MPRSANKWVKSTGNNFTSIRFSCGKFIKGTPRLVKKLEQLHLKVCKHCDEDSEMVLLPDPGRQDSMYIENKHIEILQAAVDKDRK